MKKNSIVLILPYFGEWPIWFDAHIKSIEANPSINWLIPTDCDIPEKYPKNIQFIKISFEEINLFFNKQLGFDIALNYRKFCDLKPTYGHVFEEYIQKYEFWGFCDMDIIWGNIRKYITNDDLQDFDIISSRHNAISGHFNIFRNNEELKYLYRSVNDYDKLLSSSKLTRFDENLVTAYIKINSTHFRIKWNQILCNQERGRDSHQEYYLDKWIWKNGVLIDRHINTEIMYLHFINWKHTLSLSEIGLKDEVNEFYISYSKIHSKLHTEIECYTNKFKNLFIGYWITESRRYRLLKIKSIIKRIKNKLRNDT
tara:strand:- start:1921 stop:2856 length:936 start_codon:yes stop_codon:yes gene_type:complete